MEKETPDYVYTGRDTIGGRYLRRFWHPVCVSHELPRGRALPIRVMGDEFTLYRSATGLPRITSSRCAHRRTRLHTGFVEGESIRCLYHGWRYDESGQCVEQPAETDPFCEKVRIATYPTQDYLGLVFGYFGDSPVPPFPRFPDLEAWQSLASVLTLPFNFFQNCENVVDEAHVPWVHRSAALFKGQARGNDPCDTSAEETSYGLVAKFKHTSRTVFGFFIMPNRCYAEVTVNAEPDVVGGSAVLRILHLYVPIDDISHRHFIVSARHPPWKFGQASQLQSIDVVSEIGKALEGRSNLHREISGLSGVSLQDGVALAGQDPIADRSLERLGTSDMGIILLRNIWKRELRCLREGEPLTSFEAPATFGPGEI